MHGHPRPYRVGAEAEIPPFPAAERYLRLNRRFEQFKLPVHFGSDFFKLLGEFGCGNRLEKIPYDIVFERFPERIQSRRTRSG